MPYRDDYRRLLRGGGLAVWIAVGAPVAYFQLVAPERAASLLPLAAWLASYALFGAAFFLATSRRASGASIPLLAAGQSAAVLSLVALPPCFGLEGALLVLVALEIGPRMSRRTALAWVLAQSAALFVLVWLHWGWHWGLVLAFAYLPFQLIAAATSRLLAAETAARERLAASHAELEATRELLAQSVRIAERARIARDLHDLVGHHLTALSLNLEIASHKTQGEAREHVETAQSVTKLLLGDVRGVVGELRDGDRIDLPAALQKLAEGVPRPRVHVSIAPGLVVEDPACAEVVLRCAQEVVTNAVRHAGAENLWLEVGQGAEGIEIRAEDDGRGAGRIPPGGGLTGLRERFEERGGAFSFHTAPGRGFRVTAVIPVAGVSS